jgi:hypothetical protein
MPYVVIEAHTHSTHTIQTAYVTQHPPLPEYRARFKRWVVFFEHALDADACVALRTKAMARCETPSVLSDAEEYDAALEPDSVDHGPFEYGVEANDILSSLVHEIEQAELMRHEHLAPWLKWMRAAGMAGY